MTKNSPIEERVREAFEGLAPPASVQEEIEANLPQQRPPKSSRPALWLPAAGVLLAAAVWAVRRDAPDDRHADFAGDGEIDLALVPWPGRGLTATDTVEVRLTDKGGIRVRLAALDGEWAQVNLDGWAAHLEKRTKAYDAVMRKKGKSGYEPLPGGKARASKLPIVLRIDKGAPWRHVQWLMMVCAEKYAPNIHFAALDAKGRELRLDARLPTDKGVAPLPHPPMSEIKVSIHAVARDEVEVERDGRKIHVPRKVVYRCPAGELKGLDEVGKWIAGARKAAAADNAQLLGEIKAGGKVPFRHVAALLAEYRRAGLERVEFYGTATPKAETRKKLRLPYPDRNY